jgi:hypothetical protein
MGSFFQEKFKKSLRDIYLDFVRQRALDHNPNSQFRRDGEIINGFSEKLFHSKHIIDISVDPEICIVSNDTGGFIDVPEYSARAIRFKSLKTNQNGVNVKVTLSSTTNTLDGFIYNKGISSVISQDYMQH